MPVTFAGSVLNATSLQSATEGFTPYALFASGEQGAWYDPSDYSTMFQDSAGNVRVTDVEQPVGLIRDKSGRGNHASQATPGSRPVLSARVNLLTKTEQFDDAAWTREGTTILSSTVTSPILTSTATSIRETSATSGHLVYLSAGIIMTIGVEYKYSLRVKPDGRNFVTLAVSLGISNQYSSVTFDLTGSGSVTQTSSAGGATSARSGSIVADAEGFYICTLNVSSNSSSAFFPAVACADAGTFTPDGFGRKSYAGDTSKGLIIWGADLRVSNDGVGLPAYQRVNTSTDYDTNGFPRYLRFDGSNDFLVLNNNSIDGLETSNQPFFMCAGERRNTTSYGVVFCAAGNGNATAANNDYVMLDQWNATEQVRGAIRDYTGAFADKDAKAGTLAAPATFVHSWVRSSSTGYNSVNGVAGTAVDQTLPALDLTLYTIGARRRGSTPTIDSYLNGRLYSLIVRGAASSAGQITDAEAWVNGKTKAYA